MRYYKVLKQNGSPRVQGGPRWSLPGRYKRRRGGFSELRVGLWHTVVGDLVPCKNGLHIVTAAYVKHWHEPKCRVFEVELPKGVEKKRHGRQGNRKIIVRTARLIREVQKGSPEWVAFGGCFGSDVQ